MNFLRITLPIAFALVAGCGSSPPHGLYGTPAANDSAAPVASDAPADGAPGKSTPAKWASFTSDDCGFTLPMPSTPKVGSEVVGTGAAKTTIHSATSDLGDRAAIASCSDVGAYTSSDALLDAARDGVVANSHGKLLAGRSLKVGGLPARDAVIEVEGKHLALRLVLGKKRMYTLVIVGFSSDETEKCMDGFALGAKS